MFGGLRLQEGQAKCSTSDTSENILGTGDTSYVITGSSSPPKMVMGGEENG